MVLDRHDAQGARSGDVDFIEAWLQNLDRPEDINEVDNRSESYRRATFRTGRGATLSPGALQRGEKLMTATGCDNIKYI